MFKFDKVSMSFGKDLILDKVSFSLPNKGLILISGPSGSGKSTLLNLMGGLLKQTNGEIYFKNKRLRKFSKQRKLKFYRKEIAFLFQDAHLIGDLTVLENLTLPLMFKGSAKQKAETRAHELLTKFSLNHLANQKTATLSGGERSRIALLRALINNPAIILADEPTGALDEQNSKLVTSELIKLAKEKLVVVVSHEENLFLDAADVVIRIINKEVEVKSKSKITEQTFAKEKMKLTKEGSSSGLVKRLLKRRRMQNILMIVSLSFGLVVTLLMYGFYEGANNVVANLDELYFAPYALNVSQTKQKIVTGSNFKVAEMERPSYYEVRNWQQFAPSLIIEPSLSTFISPFTTLSNDEGEKLTDFMIRYYSQSQIAHLDEVLKRQVKQGEVVIANELFLQKFSEQQVTITIQSEIISGYDEVTLLPIHDQFTLMLTPKIYEIKETSFSNTPAIYFNYDYFKDILVNTYLANLSYTLGKNVTWYEHLLNLSSKDPLSSYNWQLFVNNKGDYERLLNIGNKEVIKNTPYEFSSHLIVTHNTLVAYIDLIELTLVVFWIIMVIGMIAIYAIVLFTAIIDSSKDITIFRILGASEGTITNIFRSYNIFLSSLSLLSLLLVSPLQRKVNELLFSYFNLANLVQINWNYFNKFPYSTILLVLIVLLLVSEVLLLFTNKYFKKINMVKELQSR